MQDFKFSIVTVKSQNHGEKYDIFPHRKIAIMIMLKIMHMILWKVIDSMNKMQIQLE